MAKVYQWNIPCVFLILSISTFSAIIWSGLLSLQILSNWCTEMFAFNIIFATLEDIIFIFVLLCLSLSSLCFVFIHFSVVSHVTVLISLRVDLLEVMCLHGCWSLYEVFCWKEILWIQIFIPFCSSEIPFSLFSNAGNHTTKYACLGSALSLSFIYCLWKFPSYSFSSIHVCVWGGCGMGTCVCRCSCICVYDIDIRNSLFFNLILWGRVSLLNAELSDLANLTWQFALEILNLCLANLEL